MGEEVQQLEEKIQKLKAENELEEFVLSCSILSDLCKAKASILLEEENVNWNEVKDLKIKSGKYKQLEKETLLKLGKVILELDVDFITIKPEVIKALDEESKRKNISRDRLVRNILEQGFKRMYDEGKL